MGKVVLDFVLVTLGINLNKLLSKILNNQTEIIVQKQLRPDVDIARTRLISHALETVRPNRVSFLRISETFEISTNNRKESLQDQIT